MLLFWLLKRFHESEIFSKIFGHKCWRVSQTINNLWSYRCCKIFNHEVIVIWVRFSIEKSLRSTSISTKFIAHTFFGSPAIKSQFTFHPVYQFMLTLKALCTDNIVTSFLFSLIVRTSLNEKEPGLDKNDGTIIGKLRIFGLGCTVDLPCKNVRSQIQSFIVVFSC